MKNSIRTFFINIGVTFVTLLLMGIFCEFVVFKYILQAADLPRIDASGIVTKYAPGQTGTYRLRNEITAKFAVNTQGWSSAKNNYVVQKDIPRIAIIGDSYIEALQVDLDASVAEQLEKTGNGSFEVYRFGMSGAPLSQYLHMLRHEVLAYKPDLVIFNLVHNDFDESWNFKPGAYTSAFLKLKIDGDTVVNEIPPRPFQTTWFEPIRRSNTWRYLAVRQQVRFQILRDMILGKEQKASPKYQANIDVDSLNTKDVQNTAATRYILQQAQILCQKHNARFMVVMDGVRGVIYANPDGPFDRTVGALKLNAMVQNICQELAIPCIDLHPIFATHFRTHGHKFEFAHDGHWNKLGHTIAAQAIANKLAENPLPTP